MNRVRVIAAFAAASTALILVCVLIAAASQNRLGEVFGGIFAPILTYESPVAKVDGTNLYRRDIYMFRLIAKLQSTDGTDTGESEYSDAEARGELVDQILLAGSAAENGVSPDSGALDGALAPLYTALETEGGSALRDAYKTEFSRSDKMFNSDLRAAVSRTLTVKVFLLSLYYTAEAQGMIDTGQNEEQAILTLRTKLLTKLKVEKDIVTYNDDK
jgi:hypothetical protein